MPLPPWFVRASGALFLAAGFIAWQPAHAFTDPNGLYSSYTGGKTTIPTPVTNSNWTAGVSGSGIKIGTTATVAARNGKTVAVPVFELATETAAKRALAKMARALPLIGSGLIVLDMLREFGVFQGATGALDYDAGIAPTMQSAPCWKSDYTGTTCFGSDTAAAQAAANAQQGCPSAGKTCVATFDSAANADFHWFKWCSYNSPATSCTGAGPFAIRNFPTTALRCTDGTNPRRNGRCPGGTVTHGISDADAADHFDADGGPSPMTLTELATQITNSMGASTDAAQYPLAEPMGVGPVPDVTISTTTSTTTDHATPPHTTTTTTTEKDVGVDDGQGDIDWTTQTTTSDGLTDTTETTDPEKKPLDPCGLPTTPACAIDEKDTSKTQPTEIGDAKKGYDTQIGNLDTKIGGVSSITMPGTAITPPFSSWGDGSCSPISFEFFGTRSLNLCPAMDDYLRPFLALLYGGWTILLAFQRGHEAIRESQ